MASAKMKILKTASSATRTAQAQELPARTLEKSAAHHQLLSEAMSLDALGSQELLREAHAIVQASAR
jgi:hypothetical protein